MNKEKWIKWEPIENIPKDLYLKELNYDSNGLTLSLQEKNNLPILTINFDGFFALRIIDEGDFLTGSFERYETEAEAKSSDFIWSLYTVKNSQYLQWFNDKSCNIHKEDGIIHYLIVTDNEIVEVLDLENPTVKWRYS